MKDTESKMATKPDWVSDGTGSVAWDHDKLTLTGCYVGTSYRVVRAIHLNYGYIRRLRGCPPQWRHSYTVLIGRNDFRHRRQIRRGARIGCRTWVLLNDQNHYVISGTLRQLQAWRDHLHTEIAARLMQDLPALDTERARRWG